MDTSSRTRLLVVVAAGIVAGGVAATISAWQLAELVGWDVAALTFVVWVWSTVARFAPSETRELATREDDGRVADAPALRGHFATCKGCEAASQALSPSSCGLNGLGR